MTRNWEQRTRAPRLSFTHEPRRHYDRIYPSWTVLSRKFGFWVVDLRYKDVYLRRNVSGGVSRAVQRRRDCWARNARVETTQLV